MSKKAGIHMEFVLSIGVSGTEPTGKALVNFSKDIVKDLSFLNFFADWAPSFDKSIPVATWREIHDLLEAQVPGWESEVMETCYQIPDIKADNEFECLEELLNEAIEYMIAGSESWHTGVWIQEFEKVASVELLQQVSEKLKLI